MSSYVTGGEYLTPVRIHADRSGGRLEIEWADGHRTEYDTVTLRWLCPCAYCRGEAGMPGWLDSAPVLTPEQTQIVDIQLVGQYAVCPSWADGHHTGYYTFERLREACLCPEDTARRAVEPHTAHR
jgi:DUF971 family protein